ncbi:MAG: NAD-dependent epimerase/dehydratase family protein [Dokdonella sp.]
MNMKAGIDINTDSDANVDTGIDTRPTGDRTALILGATGGIGGEVARQMRDAGWDVRALKRGAGSPRDERDGITWLSGDAMDREQVIAASRGCSVIVHAVNPPGYKRWAELVLPMLDNTIAAATAEGATVVLPGTLYNYGPDAMPMISEDAPQHPQSRKGAIRVSMEERLRAFAVRGGRVLIVRAGNFFGPKAGNNWFSQGLVKPNTPVSKILNPSRRGVGSEWNYLPDVARSMIELLERRDTLDAFARFHLRGHRDNDGRQMVESIQRVVFQHTGKTPKASAFPWWMLTLASPINATFRELREMRYLWQETVLMDNAALVERLGEEPHTPLDEAVEATLIGLGALPSSAPGSHHTTMARS